MLVYPLWGWRRLTVVTGFIEREIDELLPHSGMSDAASAGRFGGDSVAAGASRLHHVIDVMRRNAEERERMLQFLSHDMRAPQAAIIALLDGPHGLDRDAGERIRRHAETTLGLAEDFVQLARLETQQRGEEPIDVVDAMAQAGDIVWAAARERGVTIARRIRRGDEYWITGDAAALVRAFTNLLANAVEASPPAGTVTWSIAREGSDVIATVIDDGPGLPPERRADPFARFGYSGSDSGRRGSGLGLAFVRAVAVHLGGRAEYRDGDGGGAVFVMRLPLPPEGAFNGDAD